MRPKDAFLDGKRIYLRPLRKEDAEGNYPHWFNDPEICKYNGHFRIPNTKEKALEYIEASFKNPNLLVFAIVEKDSGKHVGNVSLSKINWIDRNADIDIIIGEKECWGKGYAKEVWKMLIEYAFNVLNLHRVYCGTHEENIGMQKVAQAVGMFEEGKLKEVLYKNGKYNDILLYGIINKR